MKRILLAIIFMLASVQAHAAVSYVTATTASTGTTLSVSTGGANRFLLVARSTGMGTTGDTLSGGGLTWHKLFGVSWNIGNTVWSQWWALAPTQITSQTLTATSTGDWLIEEYSVQSCSTGAEANARGNANSTSTSTPITTVTTNAVVVAQYVYTSGLGTVSPGTGFGLNQAVANSHVGEMATAPTASPTTVTAAFSNTSSQFMGIGAVAINDCGVALSSNHNLMLMGVGS